MLLSSFAYSGRRREKGRRKTPSREKGEKGGESAPPPLSSHSFLSPSRGSKKKRPSYLSPLPLLGAKEKKKKKSCEREGKSHTATFNLISASSLAGRKKKKKEFPKREKERGGGGGVPYSFLSSFLEGRGKRKGIWKKKRKKRMRVVNL